MPIPVTCPNCATRLNAPDAAAGKKVKCPKCATPFAVPNPGQEPMAVTAAPAPRRAAPPPRDDFGDEERAYTPQGGPGAMPPSGLQMGLGIASLALGASALVIAWIPCVGAFSWPISGIGLVLGVVGLVIAFTRQNSGLAFPIAGSATSVVALGLALYWMFVIHRATSDVRDFANRVQDDLRRQQEFAQKQFADKFKDAFKNPMPQGPLAVTGAIALNGGKGEVQASLQNTDQPDPGHFGSPCKVYTVELTAGRTYQIDMMSKDMDPYLRLENPAGQQVAQDDDGGEGLNARIVHACGQTGTYRIVATCVGLRRGSFTLTVQQK